MKRLFPDWRAKGIEVVLHEHRGGFAFNIDSMHGIADKAKAEGVRILEGVRVSGFETDASGAVTRVQTDHGSIEVEQVVVGVGPWVPHLWEMLGLPARIDVRDPEGSVHRDRDMWTFWYLQEGEITVDPLMFDTADGGAPPVLHVDTDAPLYDDERRLITDDLWGIYFKRDRHGVQGGASPLTVGPDFEVDPYPTASVDPGFPDMWCAALSHCMSRFEGCRPKYKMARSGGAGAFTADNFPVFDYMLPNVYVIADSNHGYKMIGVGREVAKVLLGDHSSILYPFRFERFATGDLHPVSNSPYPWS
jgi:glycine/D-amino acid oxidase-like deaminating enzyme